MKYKNKNVTKLKKQWVERQNCLYCVYINVYVHVIIKRIYAWETEWREWMTSTIAGFEKKRIPCTYCVCVLCIWTAYIVEQANTSLRTARAQMKFFICFKRASHHKKKISASSVKTVLKSSLWIIVDILCYNLVFNFESNEIDTQLSVNVWQRIY